MPIPAFDGILNVLPPHLGAAGAINNLSPYACTTVELCKRFGTTVARKQILKGLLDLRAELIALPVQGFQWLDGSFVEDIEAQEGRAPGDMDVVTFVMSPPKPVDLSAMLTRLKPNLLSRHHVKTTYHIDHFWLSLGSNPVEIVELTRYWYGLFSHRRDRVWKGMLVINHLDKTDDDAARIELEKTP